LIPLKYNDGTPVEPEKLLQTKRELVKKFGSITIEPQKCYGIWNYRGIEYSDELIRFIIDIDPTRKADKFFKKYKEKLKIRFKQIEIWICAYPVKII